MYVLLVDDSNLIRKTIKNVLSKTKYSNVIEAQNGLEAIEMYKKFRPALVFMDLLMPNLSGTEALKKIIEFDPYANVIMCSSLGQDSVISEAIQLGAKGYVIKPFTQQMILNGLEDFFNLSSGDTTGKERKDIVNKRRRERY